MFFNQANLLREKTSVWLQPYSYRVQDAYMW